MLGDHKYRVYQHISDACCFSMMMVLAMSLDTSSLTHVKRVKGHVIHFWPNKSSLH